MHEFPEQNYLNFPLHYFSVFNTIKSNYKFGNKSLLELHYLHLAKRLLYFSTDLYYIAIECIFIVTQLD